MKSSYLIQRLQKPFKVEGVLSKLSNAFAFGGGMKNGGLSDEAMGLLREIFSFDYMGAAEFEFGAVPQALNKIAQNRKDYIAFETETKYMYKNWKIKQPIKGVAPVYVICHKDDWKEVTARIRAKAMGDYGSHKDNFHTKENVGIDRTLGGDEYASRNVGWLELDNGFFFFTDAEMYKQVAELFEIVEVPVA